MRRIERLRSELNNMRLTLLVTLLFTMLVASIFPTPAIRFMVALLCGGPFVGMAAAFFFGRTVYATHSLPDTVMVGDILNARLTLHNRAPYPVVFAQVDCTPPELPRGGSPPLLAQEGKSHIVTVLGSHESTAIPLHWQALRRGVWQLPALHAGATDPLGVSPWLKAQGKAHTLTVLPRPLQLMRVSFLAGAQQGTRALSHAASVTEAIDFHGVREWRPGEGVRRVHWKSTARTGKLQVVEWEEELSADVVVLLDVQAEPGQGAAQESSAFERAIVVTASLAKHLLESGYSIEIFCFTRSPSSGGRKALAAPLEMQHWRARGGRDLVTTLKHLALAQPLDDPAASLAALAGAAVAHIEKQRSVFLLTGETNNYTAATMRLFEGGLSPRHCTVFLFEGALPFKNKKSAPVVMATGNRNPAGAMARSIGGHGSSALHGQGVARTRFVGRNDSLVTALERD